MDLSREEQDLIYRIVDMVVSNYSEINECAVDGDDSPLEVHQIWWGELLDLYRKMTDQACLSQR